MYMREPNIVRGFIIFREGFEEQLTTGGDGHWKTAWKWVEARPDIRKEFIKVITDPTIKIYDYDDFLTDVVGAVRLFSDGGVLQCYIPRGNNCEYKSYLKNFFSTGEVVIKGRKLYFHVYGDTLTGFDKAKKITRPVPFYNQTLIKDISGNYIYNPYRIGD